MTDNPDTKIDIEALMEGIFTDRYERMCMVRKRTVQATIDYLHSRDMLKPTQEFQCCVCGAMNNERVTQPTRTDDLARLPRGSYSLFDVEDDDGNNEWVFIGNGKHGRGKTPAEAIKAALNGGKK